jgi:hypothetical protein
MKLLSSVAITVAYNETMIGIDTTAKSPIRWNAGRGMCSRARKLRKTGWAVAN